MRKPFLELFAWSCLLCSSTAWADSLDTFGLSAGVGTTRDDNLFRAPSGQEVSDEIDTTTVGFKIDKSYSLQRFRVDASATDYRYRDNDYLNYTGHNVNAVWNWKFTPALYGNLSTSRVRTLNSFVDYVAASPELRRNIRTTSISRFDVEWEALGPLHLISSVSHYDQRNSQQFVEESGYTARAAELGVKYVTAKKSSLALVRRTTNGDYSRDANPAALLDSGFDQTENEARFEWWPTVKTSLSGRVAYLDRTHDNFSERNYSGYVGALNLNWGITEKLALIASASRDINSYQQTPSLLDSYSNDYVANTFALGPVWKISEKTTLSYRHTRQRRDFEGIALAASPLREDRLSYDTLSVDWQPRAYVKVGIDYQRSRRDSNDDNFDFRANALLFTVNLYF